MVEATPGDVVMLGLDGVRVLAVGEVDGELEVTIETTGTRVGCRGCGVIASTHARREVVVRDVAAFGRRSRLRWRKQVWCCREPLCATVTWTETHEAIAARVAVAAGSGGGVPEGRRWRVRPSGREGSRVGLAHGDAGGPRRRSAAGRRPWPARRRDALGVDETAFQRANRLRHTTYVSGPVDTATGRLLDVVPDRTARAVTGWLARRDRRWLARIGVVALDPHRG